MHDTHHDTEAADHIVTANRAEILAEGERATPLAVDYTLGELLQMVREKIETYRPDRISSAADVYRLFYDYSDKEKEYVLLLTLDGASNPIRQRVIHIGTLNHSLVHPREIFRPAILDNSAGIIVVHNHPSGQLLPSSEDRRITQRLNEAARIIGIQLLDHVIISRNGFYSFSEEGEL